MILLVQNLLKRIETNQNEKKEYKLLKVLKSVQSGGQRGYYRLFKSTPKNPESFYLGGFHTTCIFFD